MNDVNKTTSRHPGRSLLLLGVLLAVAGPVLMIMLMFAAKILVAPWYAPLLGTLGVALIILALLRSRSIWRWTAVVIFTLFVGFQWWALLAMRTPAYTGPVKDGQPFPAFATTLADGSTFTQDELKGDQNTVMVFYRGHW
ncbi:MAG TPA: hypothetical protein VE999_08345 [Gemmataceae bacterium]|nr:hypothetical protein [Gemmataceae bacterium]